MDFLSHVRSESARFAESLRDVDPGARVPTCPDWNAADLVHHLVGVQTFWTTIIRRRLSDPSSVEDPPRPDDYNDLLALLDRSGEDLVDALAHTADDVAVWTWFGDDQSVGFIRRRQAHEALIHRLDAEATAGADTAVDAALAADGVSEYFERMACGPSWATVTDDGPIGRVSSTDTGDRWLVAMISISGTSPQSGNSYADEPGVRLVHAGEPTFEVSGSARDLDAWLWNRPTIGEIRSSGEVAAFENLIRTGVQ